MVACDNPNEALALLFYRLFLSPRCRAVNDDGVVHISLTFLASGNVSSLVPRPLKISQGKARPHLTPIGMRVVPEVEIEFPQQR